MKILAMIRRSVALIMACSLAFAFSFFSPPAYAALREGIDYVTLAKPLPNMDSTVLKIFSYDCPFCYKYDKVVIPNVAKILANDGIKFTIWHLHARGRYSDQAGGLFASLITKDSKAGLGVFDNRSSFKKAQFAYYRAYHDGRERWDNGPDAFLKTGLDAAEISRTEYQKLLQEPATQARLKEWEGAYEIARVQGVPAFVVKGRYLLCTKNIRSMNDMVTKIRELMAK